MAEGPAGVTVGSSTEEVGSSAQPEVPQQKGSLDVVRGLAQCSRGCEGIVDPVRCCSVEVLGKGPKGPCDQQ